MRSAAIPSHCPWPRLRYPYRQPLLSSIRCQVSHGHLIVRGFDWTVEDGIVHIVEPLQESPIKFSADLLVFRVRAKVAQFVWVRLQVIQFNDRTFLQR